MSQSILKVYKIRNTDTGLFSKGGSKAWNIWTKEGKSWSNIGHLKNHLCQFIHNGKRASDYPYDNAEIVEVEINYDLCFTTSVNEMVSGIVEKRNKIEEDLKEKLRKWREEQERKQLKELKEKYER